MRALYGVPFIILCHQQLFHTIFTLHDRGLFTWEHKYVCVSVTDNQINSDSMSAGVVLYGQLVLFMHA